MLEAIGQFETFWIGHEVEGVDLPDADMAFFPRSASPAWCASRARLDRTIDRLLADGWPLKRIDACCAPCSGPELMSFCIARTCRRKP